MQYNLECRFGNNQSFYGKATIEESEKNITLLSYNTPIVTLNKQTNSLKWLYNTYTQTTLKHVNEFLKQHNFEPITKKQFENMEV